MKDITACSNGNCKLRNGCARWKLFYSEDLRYVSHFEPYDDIVCKYKIEA